MVPTAHQRTEGNNLEDALQREEGREDDVQVLQHGLVQLGSFVELREQTRSYQNMLEVLVCETLAASSLGKEIVLRCWSDRKRALQLLSDCSDSLLQDV